jgi:hypothetical protein
VGGEPPRPSALVPGYPPALEDIVMRALRRDRDARFATAQELQLAIEDFARQAQVALSSVALSAYLGELFEDKLAAWREARRAGRSLSDHVVATATGGTLDLAALDAMTPPALAEPHVLALRHVPRRMPRHSPRRWVMALVAVAAIAGVAGAAWPVMAPDDPAAARIAPSRESAPPAPVPRIDRMEVTPAPVIDAVASEPQAPTVGAPASVRPKASNGKRAASPRPRASRAATPATPTMVTPTPPAPVERAPRWNPDSPLEP